MENLNIQKTHIHRLDHPILLQQPAQHKYAAIGYLYNRLHTYNLHDQEYIAEENTIHNIMFNNAFPIPPKNKPHQKKSTTPNKPKTTSTQKWATVTYIGKETTYITNLLKNTELKIAMRTNNSIQNILMNNKQLTNNTDKYTYSGVYKLSCPKCSKAYVGQTERNFLTRFNEHNATFRTNNQN